jgi:hypothetical protein
MKKAKGNKEIAERQKGYTMKSRFLKTGIVITTISLFFAVPPVFAMTGQEESAMGKQQVQDCASEHNWTLEEWDADDPVRVNIFDELIKKCGREQDMKAEGIQLRAPYKVETDESEELRFAASYAIITTGAINEDSNVKADSSGTTNMHRSQDIYTNSVISGVFAKGLTSTIEGNVRNTWSTAEELNGDFEALGQLDEDNTFGSLGDLIHHGIQTRVNDMHNKGVDKRIAKIYDGVPYLASTGHMMSIRRYCVKHHFNKNDRYDIQNKAISDSVNNKVASEGFNSPLLYINGKKIIAYDEGSEIREDVENADRVLYVYGKIAQAMRNGEWNRSNAVLKRESELFSISPDDNYVYLCVPLPSKYLKDPSWPTLMVVDKFYIPKQYMNATDVPYEIQEEKDKLNALLEEMSTIPHG